METWHKPSSGIRFPTKRFLLKCGSLSGGGEDISSSLKSKYAMNSLIEIIYLEMTPTLGQSQALLTVSETNKVQFWQN